MTVINAADDWDDFDYATDDYVAQMHDEEANAYWVAHAQEQADEAYENWAADRAADGEPHTVDDYLEYLEGFLPND